MAATFTIPIDTKRLILDSVFDGNNHRFFIIVDGVKFVIEQNRQKYDQALKDYLEVPNKLEYLYINFQFYRAFWIPFYINTFAPAFDVKCKVFNCPMIDNIRRLLGAILDDIKLSPEVDIVISNNYLHAGLHYLIEGRGTFLPKSTKVIVMPVPGEFNIEFTCTRDDRKIPSIIRLERIFYGFCCIYDAVEDGDERSAMLKRCLDDPLSGTEDHIDVDGITKVIDSIWDVTPSLEVIYFVPESIEKYHDYLEYVTGG